MFKTGWLSPTGEFFPCETCEHNRVAQELTGEYRFADDKLIKKGWVQISQDLIMKNKCHIFWNQHLSWEQIVFLRPYFENGGILMESYLRKRWEKETF